MPSKKDQKKKKTASKKTASKTAKAEAKTGKKSSVNSAKSKAKSTKAPVNRASKKAAAAAVAKRQAAKPKPKAGKAKKAAPSLTSSGAAVSVGGTEQRAERTLKNGDERSVPDLSTSSFEKLHLYVRECVQDNTPPDKPHGFPYYKSITVRERQTKNVAADQVSPRVLRKIREYVRNSIGGKADYASQLFALCQRTLVDLEHHFILLLLQMFPHLFTESNENFLSIVQKKGQLSSAAAASGAGGTGVLKAADEGVFEQVLNSREDNDEDDDDAGVRVNLHEQVFHYLKSTLLFSQLLGHRSCQVVWGPKGCGKHQLLRAVARDIMRGQDSDSIVVFFLDGDVLRSDEQALSSLAQQFLQYLLSRRGRQTLMATSYEMRTGTFPFGKLFGFDKVLAKLNESELGNRDSAKGTKRPREEEDGGRKHKGRAHKRAAAHGGRSRNNKDSDSEEDYDDDEDEVEEEEEEEDTTVDITDTTAFLGGGATSALPFLQELLLSLRGEFHLHVLIIIRNVENFGLHCDRLLYVLSGLMHNDSSSSSTTTTNTSGSAGGGGQTAAAAAATTSGGGGARRNRVGGMSLLLTSSTADVKYLEKRLSSRLTSETCFIPLLSYEWQMQRIMKSCAVVVKEEAELLLDSFDSFVDNGISTRQAMSKQSTMAEVLARMKELVFPFLPQREHLVGNSVREGSHHLFEEAVSWRDGVEDANKSIRTTCRNEETEERKEEEEEARDEGVDDMLTQPLFSADSDDNSGSNSNNNNNSSSGGGQSCESSALNDDYMLFLSKNPTLPLQILLEMCQEFARQMECTEDDGMSDFALQVKRVGRRLRESGGSIHAIKCSVHHLLSLLLAGELSAFAAEFRKDMVSSLLLHYLSTHGDDDSSSAANQSNLRMRAHMLKTLPTENPYVLQSNNYYSWARVFSFLYQFNDSRSNFPSLLSPVILYTRQMLKKMKSRSGGGAPGSVVDRVPPRLIRNAHESLRCFSSCVTLRETEERADALLCRPSTPFLNVGAGDSALRAVFLYPNLFDVFSTYQSHTYAHLSRFLPREVFYTLFQLCVHANAGIDRRSLVDLIEDILVSLASKGGATEGSAAASGSGARVKSQYREAAKLLHQWNIVELYTSKARGSGGADYHAHSRSITSGTSTSENTLISLRVDKDVLKDFLLSVVNTNSNGAAVSNVGQDIVGLDATEVRHIHALL